MPSSLRRFTIIRDDEVFQTIHNIPPKISLLDFTPTTILKSCSNVFALLMAMLANLSFTEGRFPDVSKFDQVPLLLKKPGADTIDKILGRLSQNQIRCHIQGSPNIGPHQSAYRTLHLMETAMTNVVNVLLATPDNKTSLILFSLNISAAFDTLDHRCLIEHMSSDSTT